MTAPARTESTAVAARAQQAPATQGTPATDAAETKSIARLRDYQALNPTAQAEYRRSQEIAGIADMVSLTEWGGRLARAGQVAMAKWCIARDADPLTELDNLGGPYLNSEYFKRKLGELRVEGIVRDWTQDNIANDPRLSVLAKDKDAPETEREWAKAEHYRRLRARAEKNVPEEAAACIVTRIYLTAGGEPIEGVKWGGNKTSVIQPKSGGGGAPNPIVENNPALSVESQSIRRAMLQLVAAHPGALRHFRETDTELKEIRAQLQAGGAAPFDERKPKPMEIETVTVGAQPMSGGDAAAVNMAAAEEEPNHEDDPFPEFPLGDRRPAQQNAALD